jgi:alpha-1,3-glucan synthase
MLSATSFQITLLSGRNGQDNTGPYVLGGVFLAATAFWYPMFRWKPSAYVLSLPWIFFGLAFLLIGVPSVHPSVASTHSVLSNVATWCYAVASAAGFLFFSLNFGEEAVCFSVTTLSSEYFLIPCRALLQRSGRSERV